ncbi:MAG: hypothetical protein ACR2II_08105 [Chthoniobacterales bacterium]
MSSWSIVAVVLGAIVILATLIMLIWLRYVPQGQVPPLGQKNGPVWLRGLWLLTLLNFFVFFYSAQSHGGDAWNGYHRGNQYFLGAKGGVYISVSRDFWFYSYYHLLSVWISFFVALAAFGWYSTRTSNAKI